MNVSERLINLPEITQNNERPCLFCLNLIAQRTSQFNSMRITCVLTDAIRTLMLQESSSIHIMNSESENSRVQTYFDLFSKQKIIKLYLALLELSPFQRSRKGLVTRLLSKHCRRLKI